MTASLIVKRSIKSAASLARSGFGYPRPLPGSINIIAYHRVVADIVKAEQEAIYGIVISTGTFRRHCEILKRTCEIVSLEKAARMLASGEIGERTTAVITFDDGYLDFYEEAYPVLAEMHLPATMFLPTALIGTKKPLAHDRIYWLIRQMMNCSSRMTAALERIGLVSDFIEQFERSASLLKKTDLLVHLPNTVRESIIHEFECELGDHFEEYPEEYGLLDWDMVREMAANGIDFGSHSANHVILPLEDQRNASEELVESKEQLETELGKRITSIAYPNGMYTEAVKGLTANAGYEIAVTTENRVNRAGADQLALGRTSLCEESTRGIAGIYSSAVAEMRLKV